MERVQDFLMLLNNDVLRILSKKMHITDYVDKNYLNYFLLVKFNKNIDMFK